MNIRFLLDECTFIATASFLRKLGFDVVTVNELGLSGLSDDKIFELAHKENRILLTFDKDFGNIFRFPLGTHPGIIIVRTHPQTVEDTNRLLKKFFGITTPEQYQNALVIIDESKIRIRKSSTATVNINIKGKGRKK